MENQWMDFIVKVIIISSVVFISIMLATKLITKQVIESLKKQGKIK